MSIIVVTLIIALAVPIGFLIAWLAGDELVQGRKWFKILFILGIASGLGCYIYGFKTEGLTSFFVAIVSLISYIKSFDKKLVNRKFI